MARVRPNIILITADQWRGDCLGAVGHPTVRTPHLDALADEAVVFRNHFAPCIPCGPARASLYTGLYQMNHRVVWNGTPLDARFDNIALAARRAGYCPTLFGYTDTTLDPRGRDPDDPELYTYEGVLPGFDAYQPMTDDEAAWRIWLAEKGYGPEVLDDLHAAPPAPAPAAPGYHAEHTQTAFLVDRFDDWHRQQGDVPWFAHMSFLRPHPPFVVPEPYASMFDPSEGPVPVQRPKSPHILPSLMAGMYDLAEAQPGLTGTVSTMTPEVFARIRATYFGMIAEVDAQIGRLFDLIKAAGEWDNTLVIFTSDHADMMGDQGLLGKGGFFAESQHVPLLIRAPGGQAGQVAGFTSAVDVFPTLLDLLEIAPLHAPDGQSLLGHIDGGDKPFTRDSIFWEFDFRHLIPDEVAQAFAMTSRDCHLSVLRRADAQLVYFPTVPPVLFDLAQDPRCEAPVEDPAHPLWREMMQALLSHISRSKDETLAPHLAPQVREMV